MPNKRYGVSATLTPHKQYGVSSSADPVLSRQKRYGMVAEIRQVIRTMYPLQAPAYSLRHGAEEQESYASLRPRKRLMHEEDDPGIYMHRFQISEIVLHVPEELQNETQHETILEELTLADSTAHLVTLEIPTEATRENLYDTVHLQPLEEIASNSVSGVQEHHLISMDAVGVYDITDEGLMTSELISPIFAAEEIRTVAEVTRHSTQEEVFLHELEDFLPPYTEIYEHKSEQIQRVVPIDWIDEQKPDLAMNEQEPILLLESAFDQLERSEESMMQVDAFEMLQYVDIPEEIVTISPEPSSIRTRTTDIVEETPEEGSQHSGHLVQMEETNEGELLNIDNQVILEANDMAQGTRPDEIFLVEEQQLDDASSTGEYDLAPLLEIDYSMIHATDETIVLELSTPAHPVVSITEIVEENSPEMNRSPQPFEMEMVLASAMDRIVPEYEIFLEELEGFNGITFLVDESTFDVAERVDRLFTSALESNEWTNAPIKTLDVLEHIVQEADPLPSNSDIVLSTWNTGTNSRMFHFQSESSDKGTLEKETDVALISLEEATLETHFDVSLEHSESSDKTKMHELVVETLDVTSIERKEEIMMESIEFFSRTQKELLLEQLAEMERAPIYLTQIEELSFADRTMKPILLTDIERAERKEMHDFLIEQLEGADFHEKKKKKIWLIPAHGNHWNNWSGWKKTR